MMIIMREAESGRLYLALFLMMVVSFLHDICQNFRSGGTRPPGAKNSILAYFMGSSGVQLTVLGSSACAITLLRARVCPQLLTRLVLSWVFTLAPDACRLAPVYFLPSALSNDSIAYAVTSTGSSSMYDLFAFTQ